MSLERLRSENEDRISIILKWLWDCVAEPILSVVPFQSDIELPRIWWCPTGLMSFLPIHAAGYHFENSKRTVIDRAVSSYTATLKALEYARKKTSLSQDDNIRVLIAIMPITPGYESLPSANNEAYGIKKVTRRWSTKRKVQISIETSITVQKLGEELPNQTIVHLICHAVTEGVASKSRLLLRDGYLTVAQIARMKLEQVGLAYLSACSSAYSSDTLLDDESITLASAFQVAGYPRVVGTLWNTVDDIACTVALTFYETLENDLTKSAESLHRAILNQRIQAPNEPSLWAAFICVGD